MPIYNGIINQKGTPAFFSDIFANRPAFGYAGRVFISTDTGAIYEDTGTAWTLIADAGAGTTGTLQQVTTNGNTTTLGIVVDGININNGAGTGTENTAIGKSSLANNTTGLNNTALGSYSLGFNTTGNNNTALGVNSLITNTTGIQNTAIGVSALYTNTTGGNNAAVGYNSLFLNTTGSNNTALGVAALGSNTTASQNTAVGNSALSLNTTGANNVAIGYQSLYLNTTGASQTAVGTGSLQNNTTGASNTAIGSTALQNNTTGGQNTALGTSALSLNTTASNNTSIGFVAMQFNTTGANNTAIGSGTLTLNTTGLNNTAIGQSSLGANLTGSYNVALGVGTLANNLASYNVGIGHSSLNAITTGTNNSAIGYASGSAITTGSNNTIIGGYGGTTTLASNIVLSDGGGNVRLFSDANGLIGIGQAVGTPGGQLDIHTTQTYALVLNGLTTNNAYTAFSNNSVGKWRIGNTYNAGANSFDIFNLGTSSAALTINATTNNIGIGISSPSKLLHLYNTAATDVMLVESTQVFSTIAFKSSTNSSTVTVGIDGVGNASFENKLTTGAMAFVTNGSERMRITSGGNVLVGTTTDNGVKLQVNGTATINNATGFGALDVGGQLNATTQNVCRLGNISGVNNGLIIQLNSSNNYIYNFGTLGTGSVVATANVLSATSDMNLKIADGFIENALDKVLKILPRYFYWKGETGMPTNLRQLGFFAQEINECLGEEVANAPKNNNEKWGIYDRGMIAMLVKAIQELNEKLVRNNIN